MIYKSRLISVNLHPFLNSQQVTLCFPVGFPVPPNISSYILLSSSVFFYGMRGGETTISPDLLAKLKVKLCGFNFTDEFGTDESPIKLIIEIYYWYSSTCIVLLHYNHAQIESSF